MKTKPFNEVAHEAIIAAGYDYLHVPAECYDDGSPESGPHLVSYDAFDQYSKTIGMDDDGVFELVEFIYIGANENGVEILPDYPE